MLREVPLPTLDLGPAADGALFGAMRLSKRAQRSRASTIRPLDRFPVRSFPFGHADLRLAGAPIPCMLQPVMKVVRRSSGFSASVQLSPRCLRIFTVCHFKPRRAAHIIAGRVTSSKVIKVAPAQIVVRIGLRGMTTEEKSEVRACMVGHLG